MIYTYLGCIVYVSWQHTKQKNLERDAPQQIDGERHRKQRQLNSF